MFILFLSGVFSGSLLVFEAVQWCISIPGFFVRFSKPENHPSKRRVMEWFPVNPGEILGFFFNIVFLDLELTIFVLYSWSNPPSKPTPRVNQWYMFKVQHFSTKNSLSLSWSEHFHGPKVSKALEALDSQSSLLWKPQTSLHPPFSSFSWSQHFYEISGVFWSPTKEVSWSLTEDAVMYPIFTPQAVQENRI